MHLRLLRAAATVALLGGTATIGLGSTQAAMADPPPTVLVQCGASYLIAAMTEPVSGSTLVLTPHCNYVLTSTNELPTVMTTLTIVGHDSTWVERSTTDEDPAFSVFTVGCATGDLTLVDVNVSNGGGAEQDGGAIYLDHTGAEVTVKGGIFSHNNATEETEIGGYGGAIFNEDGTLTVEGATFNDNGAEYGGAIYSDSDSEASLVGNTFFDNSATYGGAIYNDNDDAMVSAGDIFRSNTATDDGGAIDNASALTIDRGQIGQNTAGEDGGGVYNSGEDADVTIAYSVLTLNMADDDPDTGGGVYNDDGTVTLVHDTIGINTPDNCYPAMTGCHD
jgi:predicted outer membrane repeat protein